MLTFWFGRVWSAYFWNFVKTRFRRFPTCSFWIYLDKSGIYFWTRFGFIRSRRVITPKLTNKKQYCTKIPSAYKLCQMLFRRFPTFHLRPVSDIGSGRVGSGQVGLGWVGWRSAVGGRPVVVGGSVAGLLGVGLCGGWHASGRQFEHSKFKTTCSRTVWSKPT